MKYKPWILMFIGAGVCALICAFMIWRITVTGDVSLEWLIYIFMTLGFFLFGGGYVYENKYKRDHPDEFRYEWPEE
ncbi:MAG: hypothetical protein NWE89_14465 [Candidatus Bathyarchaeota archaeon]|nr:hypothetical protein [Candidatus Bathyarchaeota archaeon]